MKNYSLVINTSLDIKEIILKKILSYLESNNSIQGNISNLAQYFVKSDGFIFGTEEYLEKEFKNIYDYFNSQDQLYDFSDG